VEYACTSCQVVDVAGRIQNSKLGLAHPDAPAVIVTGVPEPTGKEDGGENDSLAEVHGENMVYGVEL
jgi:hypothetical protein